MLDDFSKVRVLVVGDVMLDRYWWGTVNRISPEAPVPVVSLDSTTVTGGGAANVAANVAGLGATCDLVGITGDDEEAGLLPGVLSACGISAHRLFPIAGRRTTLKNRIVAHNQQMIRMDQETAGSISSEDAELILSELRPMLDQYHVIVLSDYAKGFMTDEVVRGTIEHARRLNKRVVIDPKGRDYSKYRGASILTPNQREAAEACSLESDGEETVHNAGRQLLADLDLQALLVTRGENGMTLFEPDVPPRHIEAHARKVYNVTGAGDTAIATVAVALGAGISYLDAARFANYAAGLVVENLGTTAITREMLGSLNEIL